jgi:hypothetical protein
VDGGGVAATETSDGTKNRRQKKKKKKKKCIKAKEGGRGRGEGRGPLKELTEHEKLKSQLIILVFNFKKKTSAISSKSSRLMIFVHEYIYTPFRF